MKKLLPLLLAALAIAGCGSGGGASSGDVKVANTDVGDVLADAQGRTLYMFERDTAGKSSCTGSCASDWPPDTTAKPTAGKDVTASKLTTIKRSDGGTQVAYAGHPLYRFAGDKKAGDTNGQGLDEHGGKWYVVTGAGDAVTTKPSSGGGYGGY